MKKTFLFVLIINLIIFVALEITVKLSLKYLGYSTVQKYANISSHQFDYTTGYYKGPFESEKKNNDGSIVKLGTDRYGFAIDGTGDVQRDLISKNKCSYRVFLLGGSTVEGRFLEDKFDTISARLEKTLNQDFNNIKFEVINTGISSFQSSQEISLFLYKILYSMKPDHVIFFNGSNEFANSLDNVDLVETNSHLYQRELKENIKNSSKNIFYSLDNMLAENLSLYFASKKVMKKLAQKFQKREKQNIDTDNDKIEKVIEKHVYRYFYNMQIAENLSSTQTSVSVFFQPTLLPESIKNASSEEMKIIESVKNNEWGKSFYLDAKQIYYDKVREGLKNKKNSNENFQFLDLSGIFSNKSNELSYFGDHVHYLPESRKVIVENIYSYIKPLVLKNLNLNFNNCTK